MKTTDEKGVVVTSRRIHRKKSDYAKSIWEVHLPSGVIHGPFTWWGAKHMAHQHEGATVKRKDQTNVAK